MTVFRRILVLSLSLILAARSSAFDVRTHIWVAQQVINDVVEDGHVRITTADGRALDYPVSAQVRQALTAHPSAYRMGSIGPDASPDPLVGQSVIHPGAEGAAGRWELDQFLHHLHEQATTPEELAYALGAWCHAAGDVFAHTYVNRYSGGVFNVKDGETDVEARHMALEKYIRDNTPPIADEFGRDIGPLSEAIALPKSFVAKSWILSVPKERYSSATSQHLVAMAAIERLSREAAEAARNDAVLGRIDAAFTKLQRDIADHIGRGIQLEAEIRGKIGSFIGVPELVNRTSPRAAAVHSFIGALDGALTSRRWLLELEKQVIDALTDAVDSLVGQLASWAEEVWEAVTFQEDSGVEERLNQAKGSLDAASKRKSAIEDEIRNIETAQQKLRELETTLQELDDKEFLISELAKLHPATTIAQLPTLLTNWNADVNTAIEEYADVGRKFIGDVLIGESLTTAARRYEIWWACKAPVFLGRPGRLAAVDCAARETFAEAEKALEKGRKYAEILLKETGAFAGVEKKIQEIRDKADVLSATVAPEANAYYHVLTGGHETDPAARREAVDRIFAVDASGKGLRTFANLSQIIDLDMHASDGVFSPKKFRPAAYAVTMAKLTLLDVQTLRRLAIDVASPDTPVIEITAPGALCLLDFAVRSIDGNDQWNEVGLPPLRASAPGYAPVPDSERRFGYALDAGHGFRLKRDPMLCRKLFPQLFPDLNKLAENLALPEGGPFEESCSAITGLDPALYVSWASVRIRARAYLRNDGCCPVSVQTEPGGPFQVILPGETFTALIDRTVPLGQGVTESDLQPSITVRYGTADVLYVVQDGSYSIQTPTPEAASRVALIQPENAGQPPPELVTRTAAVRVTNLTAKEVFVIAADHLDNPWMRPALLGSGQSASISARDRRIKGTSEPAPHIVVFSPGSAAITTSDSRALATGRFRTGRDVIDGVDYAITQVGDGVSLDPAVIEPVHADVDGDGRTDIGQFVGVRGSCRFLFDTNRDQQVDWEHSVDAIRHIRANYGSPPDLQICPIVGDMNGDRRVDFGAFYFTGSTSGYHIDVDRNGTPDISGENDALRQVRTLLGGATPLFLRALTYDHDGDGRADPAVFFSGADRCGILADTRRSGVVEPLIELDAPRHIRARLGRTSGVRMLPVAADFDRNGRIDLGVFSELGGRCAFDIDLDRNGTSDTSYPDHDAAKHVTYAYPKAMSFTYAPLAVDFNGNGSIDCGVYFQADRAGGYHFDLDRNGTSDTSYTHDAMTYICPRPEVATDTPALPVVGDVNGDGKVDLGIFFAVGDLTGFRFDTNVDSAPDFGHDVSVLPHIRQLYGEGASVSLAPVALDVNRDGRLDLGVFASTPYNCGFHFDVDRNGVCDRTPGGCIEFNGISAARAKLGAAATFKAMPIAGPIIGTGRPQVGIFYQSGDLCGFEVDYDLNGTTDASYSADVARHVRSRFPGTPFLLAPALGDFQSTGRLELATFFQAGSALGLHIDLDRDAIGFPDSSSDLDAMTHIRAEFGTLDGVKVWPVAGNVYGDRRSWGVFYRSNWAMGFHIGSVSGPTSIWSHKVDLARYIPGWKP